MITFLPYPAFSDSARVLDSVRLGKQREDAYQIILTLSGESKKWEDHPIMDMWDGYISALALYGAVMCREWTSRGHTDNLLPEFMRFINKEKGVYVHRPSWCRSEKFHLSHRSNLVRMFPEYYKKFFPRVPANLPYIWPISKGEKNHE